MDIRISMALRMNAQLVASFAGMEMRMYSDLVAEVHDDYYDGRWRGESARREARVLGFFCEIMDKETRVASAAVDWLRA
jgi:hypothetical protein